MQKLYGTVVPIVTPLTEEDTIDVESLKNLVNHVIDQIFQRFYINVYIHVELQVR